MDFSRSFLFWVVGLPYAGPSAIRIVGGERQRGREEESELAIWLGFGAGTFANMAEGAAYAYAASEGNWGVPALAMGVPLAVSMAYENGGRAVRGMARGISSAYKFGRRCLPRRRNPRPAH